MDEGKSIETELKGIKIQMEFLSIQWKERIDREKKEEKKKE